MLDRERDPAESTATVGEERLADSSIAILVPGSRIGERYEIRGVLGTGGSSVVYRAYDRDLRRELALKVLRSDRLDESSLTRLRREAAAARDTASPRLVRVFDIGSSGNVVYLSMELVEGTTLKGRLRAGRLEIEEAVRISIQVLEAVGDLHEVGLVHRDLKPSNILLAPGGAVKVGDLGLAFRMDGSDSRATRTEAVVGTLEYLSPEQALGEALTVRSDIFSAGVVLYEMLTGDLPWARSSNLGLLLARVGESAPNVRKARPEVPRWLAKVLDGMLRRRAEERYRSAADVIADLRRQRAPRFLARFVRSRRWRLAAALAGLGAVALAGADMFMRRPASSFSHLAFTETGLTAVSRRGDRLWSKDGISPLSVVTARLDHRGLKVVGILGRASDYTSPDRHLLSVIEPDTGRVLETIRLPNAAAEFPDHADRFGPSVWASDFDGDGFDEVVVTYVHIPSWPSYVVLYEPLIRRSRVLFVGSGHHHFARAADVDGDGHREVILLGTNNRMGWYATMTAISVRPWINDAQRGRSLLSVRSPDLASVAVGEEPLWYALLPNGFCGDYENCVSVDDRLHRFEIAFNHGERVTVGFDGFVPTTPSSRPERQEHRRLAYRHLREARRLLQVGLGSDGLAEMDSARDEARLANDALLEEWVARSRGTFLAGIARSEESQEIFHGLFEISNRSLDIAFDAAKAFHLSGDLDRAVDWYRRGIGVGANNTRGRPTEDFVEGAILALVEQGRFEDASGEVRRFESAFPRLGRESAVLGEYVRWRRGELPRTEIPADHSSSDLRRYWMLEFELADGADPGPLLAAVDGELAQSSETRAMLLSLKAELLLRLGKPGPALSTATQAQELADLGRGDSVEVRAHADLIETRYRRARSA
jgi:tRNA A-37 threonylcarbamoyl transferase component Bud32